MCFLSIAAWDLGPLGLCVESVLRTAALVAGSAAVTALPGPKAL